MAKSWRDYSSSRSDDSDDRDKSPSRPPIVPFVTNVTALPALIADSLAKLRAMAVPSGCDPARWAVVRADAERLAIEGWAELALRLGWSHLDLFGCAWGDCDREADGLAVWLDGRKLRALSNGFAVVVDDGDGRSYFNRPRAPGARLLWSLGSQ